MQSYVASFRVLLVTMLLPASLAAYGTGQPALPENLAATAKISASSAFSPDYQAENVVDGHVPAALSHDDVRQAWCVHGATANDTGDLTFEWAAPVSVAELVYYGRTAWFLNECWKDYAVYADDTTEPFLKGTLQMMDGPQRISLGAPVSARKLRLHFINSYGGQNPGASEVMVFGSPAPDEALKAFLSLGVLRFMPWVDQADPVKLGNLMDRLGDLHGGKYAQAAEHRTRLEALRQTQDAPGLAHLQRDVLLFDVDWLVAIKRHEISASHVYTYHYEGFQAGGGLYVVSGLGGEPVFKELVASPEGEILDCDLSYDGRVVLFSWRQKADEGCHLWTVHVDGSGLHQLTDGAWHDYNGCWLPDGGIAFLSTRTAQFAYCWHAPVGVLHRMNADGSNVTKLSANYLNDFTPYVLEDGRVIYSRWEYVDRPAIPIQSLWTINPDGSGLAGYFGNRVLSPGTFMEARQVPGTEKIVCTMTGHNGPTRGAIGIIDRRFGVNAQAAIENITPDVPVPPVDQGNGNTDGTKQYSCPCPLDSQRLLLSIQGSLLVRDFAGTCQALALPAPDDGMQYFSAQPVRPRYRPPVIPKEIPDTPEDAFAAVYLQDVYAGLEPAVARGEVKRVRIVREMPKTVRVDPSQRAFGFQFPVISCGATYAGKDVLGEVPIETDGSAHFRVPAGIPVYFMALDAEGRAVQRMRSFTHFMPGEKQSCIGCHEPRLQAAPARNGTALHEAPRDIEPPEWGAGGFGYWRIVQPVLDRYCVQCHNALDTGGGIDLAGSKTDYFNVSYEMLARDNQGPEGSPYVKWIPTYNGQEQNILKIAPRYWGSPSSKLAEIVRNGHPDGAGKPRFEMDEASKRRIFAWIDLDVPYYDTSETAYPDHEGCRRIYSKETDRVLADVVGRRCVECHTDRNIHRREWTRITEPELNNFLIAPLSRAAGGSEKCGKAVFLDTTDPDYGAILATLKPLEEMLQQAPRMDMPGAKPAPNLCRDKK